MTRPNKEGEYVLFNDIFCSINYGAVGKVIQNREDASEIVLKELKDYVCAVTHKLSDDSPYLCEYILGLFADAYQSQALDISEDIRKLIYDMGLNLYLAAPKDKYNARNFTKLSSLNKRDHYPLGKHLNVFLPEKFHFPDNKKILDHCLEHIENKQFAEALEKGLTQNKELKTVLKKAYLDKSQKFSTRYKIKNWVLLGRVLKLDIQKLLLKRCFHGLMTQGIGFWGYLGRQEEFKLLQSNYFKVSPFANYGEMRQTYFEIIEGRYTPQTLGGNGIDFMKHYWILVHEILLSGLNPYAHIPPVSDLGILVTQTYALSGIIENTQQKFNDLIEPYPKIQELVQLYYISLFGR